MKYFQILPVKCGFLRLSVCDNIISGTDVLINKIMTENGYENLVLGENKIFIQ